MSLLVQGVLWHVTTFVDEEAWTTRVVQLAHDMGSSQILQNQNYGGHPGMAALMPAALLYAAGVAALPSLVGGITMFTALATATTVIVCWWLRPHSYWWLATAAVLLFQPLFIYTTPTHAVISPLLALIFVLALAVYEQKKTAALWLLLALGASIGAAAATRMTETLLITGCLMLFLATRGGVRRLVIVIGAALCTAIVLDPFLWQTPIQHLRYVLGRTNLHYFDAGTALKVGAIIPPLTNTVVTASFLLAGVSIGLAVSFLIFRLASDSRFPMPVPWQFLSFMLGITLFFGLLLMAARSQSPRYYYPFVFVWQAYLPLLLLAVVGRSFSGKMPVQIGVALLTASQALLASVALAAVAGFFSP